MAVAIRNLLTDDAAHIRPDLLARRQALFNMVGALAPVVEQRAARILDRIDA